MGKQNTAIMGIQNTAIFTFKSLLTELCTPPDNRQAAASPKAFFLDFCIYKKSLVKRLSLSFEQTLACKALQQNLPTIFQ
jgi:hypothetical protein